MSIGISSAEPCHLAKLRGSFSELSFFPSKSIWVCTGTKDFPMPAPCIMLCLLWWLVLGKPYLISVFIYWVCCTLRKSITPRIQSYEIVRDYVCYFHYGRIFILLGQTVLDCKLLRDVQDVISSTEGEKTSFTASSGCICCLRKMYKYYIKSHIKYHTQLFPFLWTFLTHFCKWQPRKLVTTSVVSLWIQVAYGKSEVCRGN